MCGNRKYYPLVVAHCEMFPIIFYLAFSWHILGDYLFDRIYLADVVHVRSSK